MGEYKQFIIHESKIPTSPLTFQRIGVHDRDHFVDFDTAYNAIQGKPNMGVGFVFTESDPFWFLDIDKCLQDDNTWSPLALDILASLPGAAVEVSSSGRGLHLFGVGTPKVHANKNTDLKIELYTKERFVAFGHLSTMTGNAWQDFTNHLNVVVDKYFQPRITPQLIPANWTTTAQEGWCGSDDDEVLIEIALASKSASSVFGDSAKASFKDLWTANVKKLSEAYPANDNKKPYDASSADLALFTHLNFYTGGNAERMARLARKSALVRDKWERDDYFKGSIMSVLPNRNYYNNPEFKKVVVSEQQVSDPRYVNAGLGRESVPWVYTDAKGKPKKTSENFQALLDFQGISYRFNLMNRRASVDFNTGMCVDSSVEQEHVTATLRSLCARFDLSEDCVKNYLNDLCFRNTYHPVKEWVESKPWDGIDRFNDLIDTLDVKPQDRTFTSLLVKKWLLTGVNFLIEKRPRPASGLLVLQGEQNLGKSRWFKKLLSPKLADTAFKGEFTLNTHEKDSIIIATTYFLTEMAEIDATFRKSDVAALKSFITSSDDTYRRSYAEFDSKIPRRTLFCATVNPDKFLRDDTGNRRYWTIAVGNNMESDYQIDPQQLWAQMFHIHRQEPDFPLYLNRHENDQLNRLNGDFMVDSGFAEVLNDNYDLDAPATRKLTASEVYKELYTKQPTHKEILLFTKSLASWLGEDRVIRPKGASKKSIQYAMPETRNLFK